MIPKALKEEWLKSETHGFIAEKMLVLENGFEIKNVKVTMLNSNAFGAHLEFYLNNELCFITVLADSLISKSDGSIREGLTYNLRVLDHKKCLKVFVSSKTQEAIYTLECRELTMGPVFGKRINI